MNHATVPAPIRQVPDTFKDFANNPALYRADVDTLNFAMMEIAAEAGVCPRHLYLPARFAAQSEGAGISGRGQALGIQGASNLPSLRNGMLRRILGAAQGEIL